MNSIFKESPSRANDASETRSTNADQPAATNPEPLSLLDLPTELIDPILQFVLRPPPPSDKHWFQSLHKANRRDLLAFAHASKFCLRLATPILYRDCSLRGSETFHAFALNDFMSDAFATNKLGCIRRLDLPYNVPRKHLKRLLQKCSSLSELRITYSLQDEFIFAVEILMKHAPESLEALHCSMTRISSVEGLRTFALSLPRSITTFSAHSYNNMLDTRPLLEALDRSPNLQSIVSLPDSALNHLEAFPTVASKLTFAALDAAQAIRHTPTLTGVRQLDIYFLGPASILEDLKEQFWDLIMKLPRLEELLVTRMPIDVLAQIGRLGNRKLQRLLLIEPAIVEMDSSDLEATLKALSETVDKIYIAMRSTVDPGDQLGALLNVPNVNRWNGLNRP